MHRTVLIKQTGYSWYILFIFFFTRKVPFVTSYPQRLFWKGVYPKRKEGANSFLFIVVPIQKGYNNFDRVASLENLYIPLMFFVIFQIRWSEFLFTVFTDLITNNLDFSPIL